MVSAQSRHLLSIFVSFLMNAKSRPEKGGFLLPKNVLHFGRSRGILKKPQVIGLRELPPSCLFWVGFFFSFFDLSKKQESDRISPAAFLLPKI